MKTIISVIFLLIFFVGLNAQSFEPSISAIGGSVLHFFNTDDELKISSQNNYMYGFTLSHPIFKSNISLKTGYYRNSKKYMETYADTISWYPKNKELEFTYVNIPIFICYKYKINRIVNIVPSVGFVLGKLLKEKQLTTFNNGSIKDGFHPKIENEKSPKYISTNLSINFNLSQNLSINCNSWFNYRINGNSSINYDRASKKGLYLFLGITYKI